MTQRVNIGGPSGDGMQEWQYRCADDLHTIVEHASAQPLLQGFVHVGVRHVDRRRFTVSQLVPDALDCDLRVCVDGFGLALQSLSARDRRACCQKPERAA